MSDWGLSELQIATIDGIVGVFEGGRPFRYETVARVKSDPGGLSFGKHQVSHTSGNLHMLMSTYCSAAKADSELASRVRARLAAMKVPAPQSDREKEKKRLESIESKRLELLADDPLKELLIATAGDRAMADAQDKYFFENFMTPALKAWQAAGFRHALSAAVAYDSQIQSGVAFRKDQRLKADEVAGPASAENEKEWIAAYVAARRQWLSESKSEAVRNSVYRMDAMKALIDAGAWDLALPLTVHGYELTAWDDFSPASFDDPYRRDGFAKFGTLSRTSKWTGRGRFINRCLISLKYLPARSASSIGKFDDVAVAALKEFQTKCGLPSSGTVDADTFDRLCAEAAVADARTGGAATADGFKELPPEMKTKAPVGSTAAAGAAGAAAAGAAALGGGDDSAKTAGQTITQADAGAPESAAIETPAPVPSQAVQTTPAQPAPVQPAPVQPTAPTHAGTEAPPFWKPVEGMFKGGVGTVLICVAFVLAVWAVAMMRKRWA